MMWEYRVEVIAMVTNEVESNRLKCHRYWPESEDKGVHTTMTFGQHLTVNHIRTDVYVMRSGCGWH